MRLLLATTVAVIREGRTGDALADVDRRLGLTDPEPAEDDDEGDDPFADADQAESDSNRAALLAAGYGQIVSS